MTFTDELERLAALQSVDSAIKQREDRVAELQREADEIGGGLTEKRSEIERLNAERATMDARRAELEEKMQVEYERIKGGRMRMARTRNERDILIAQHEINQAKETNEKFEEELLTVMETIEKADAEMAAVEAVLEETQGRSQGEVQTCKAQIEDLQSEIAVERKRRDTVTQGMSDALRARYEQIFARRGGLAVVAVHGGTCQGCHMHVPPQLYNELQRTRDIHQCPSCRRILHWKPEEEADAAAG